MGPLVCHCLLQNMKTWGDSPSPDKKLGRCFQKEPIFLSSWKAGSSLRGDQGGPVPLIPARSSVSFPFSRWLRSHCTHLTSRSFRWSSASPEITHLSLVISATVSAAVQKRRSSFRVRYPHRHRRSARTRGGGAPPAPRRSQAPTGGCETLTRPDHPR